MSISKENLTCSNIVNLLQIMGLCSDRNWPYKGCVTLIKRACVMWFPKYLELNDSWYFDDKFKFEYGKIS